MRLLSSIIVISVLVAPGAAAGVPAAFLAGPRIGVAGIAGDGPAHLLGGAAVHYVYLPGIRAEIAACRHASVSLKGVEVRAMPVTASAVLDLVPSVYAAGGFGLYATTFEWTGAASHKKTDRDFGWHLGSGFRIARESGPQILVDARYHWIDATRLDDPPQGVPSGRVEPDFWSAHLEVLFPLP
jgi:hypothetical protein